MNRIKLAKALTITADAVRFNGMTGKVEFLADDKPIANVEPTTFVPGDTITVSRIKIILEFDNE